MAVGRVILAGVAFLLWAAPTAAAARPLRLLYVGDWAGPREVFIADHARPGAGGQGTAVPGCELRSSAPTVRVIMASSARLCTSLRRPRTACGLSTCTSLVLSA